MNFQSAVSIAKLYFPNLKIKYKDESKFMKFIGFLLFFNKDFLKTFTTTIGSTIYFTSESYTKTHIFSSIIILLHELVHISDANKYGHFLFSILYLTPQIFFLLFFLFLFINIKIAFLFCLFLLPIPSYIRMVFERRAYFASLYVMKRYSTINNYNINLEEQRKFFLEQFKNSSYYYMWPFKNIDNDFSNAISKINSNERPYDDKIFNILDEIIINSSIC